MNGNMVGFHPQMASAYRCCFLNLLNIINPFAPGDFAEKGILKLVEWFSGHCCAIKS